MRQLLNNACNGCITFSARAIKRFKKRPLDTTIELLDAFPPNPATAAVSGVKMGVGIVGVVGIAAKGNRSLIGLTKHGLNQKINRKVRSTDVLDALKRPLDVNRVKLDNLGRPSQRFVGPKAEVVMNPNTGKIISVNPTSTRKSTNLQKRNLTE